MYGRKSKTESEFIINTQMYCCFTGIIQAEMFPGCFIRECVLVVLFSLQKKWNRSRQKYTLVGCNSYNLFGFLQNVDRQAKQEHDETWNNPRMYLKSGMLGPYYDLHRFKATDALDTADLKMLKLSGVLKYRVRENV